MGIWSPVLEPYPSGISIQICSNPVGWHVLDSEGWMTATDDMVEVRIASAAGFRPNPTHIYFMSSMRLISGTIPVSARSSCIGLQPEWIQPQMEILIVGYFTISILSFVSLRFPNITREVQCDGSPPSNPPCNDGERTTTPTNANVEWVLSNISALPSVK